METPFQKILSKSDADVAPAERLQAPPLHRIPRKSGADVALAEGLEAPLQGSLAKVVRTQLLLG